MKPLGAAGCGKRRPEARFLMPHQPLDADRAGNRHAGKKNPGGKIRGTGRCMSRRTCEADPFLGQTGAAYSAVALPARKLTGRSSKQRQCRDCRRRGEWCDRTIVVQSAVLQCETYATWSGPPAGSPRSGGQPVILPRSAALQRPIFSSSAFGLTGFGR